MSVKRTENFPDGRSAFFRQLSQRNPPSRGPLVEANDAIGEALDLSLKPTAPRKILRGDVAIWPHLGFVR